MGRVTSGMKRGGGATVWVRLDGLKFAELDWVNGRLSRFLNAGGSACTEVENMIFEAFYLLNFLSFFFF